MNLFITTASIAVRLPPSCTALLFSSAIRLLHTDLRPPIYNIYGFVRFADEIVDTFPIRKTTPPRSQFKKKPTPPSKGASASIPILHGFQMTVKEYNLSVIHRSFLQKHGMDLSKTKYITAGIQGYIYGSAEGGGSLMCLYVFAGNRGPRCMSAWNPLPRPWCGFFRKWISLRDVKADSEMLGRTYFPRGGF